MEIQNLINLLFAQSKRDKKMAYPNFKNKHLEEALFNPSQYVEKYLRIMQKTRLKKYILIYHPKVLNHFKRRYKPEKIRLNHLISIYTYKDIGVIRMGGIGSPNAATILEELIALGGKVFINIGYAGGLDDFGYYLCDKAIRDEGTSYHYFPHGRYIYPDNGLTEDFGKSLADSKLQFQKGATWTIDAPYRETKAEIRHYKKNGVKTVEMEASALFAVAKFRKVKIASAFVVSDVLGEKKWDPQFTARHVISRLNKLFDVAVEHLINR
jgi:uridine phosphorylase